MPDSSKMSNEELQAYVNPINALINPEYFEIVLNTDYPVHGHIVITKQSLVILAMQTLTKNIALRNMCGLSEVTKISEFIRENMLDQNTVKDNSSDFDKLTTALKDSGLSDDIKLAMLNHYTMIVNSQQQSAMHNHGFNTSGQMGNMFNPSYPNAVHRYPVYTDMNCNVNTGMGFDSSNDKIKRQIANMTELTNKMSMFYFNTLGVIEAYKKHNNNDSFYNIIGILNDNIVKYQSGYDEAGRAKAMDALRALNSIDENVFELSVHPDFVGSVTISFKA